MWGKYVSMDQRRKAAAKLAASAAKKGQVWSPITLTGHKLCETFWGQAWCKHLDSLSDYATRLPRGKRYARNGSILDVQIAAGQITGRVMGSSLYTIHIGIQPLPQPRWEAIKQGCAGQIDSLIELLQGKCSEAVMRHVVDPEHGLFPHPSEIELQCSCPDWANLCKHVAAVLYGAGGILDVNPEMLFVLRGVDHAELLHTSIAGIAPSEPATDLDGDLGELFGIDLADDQR